MSFFMIIKKANSYLNSVISQLMTNDDNIDFDFKKFE